MMERITSRQNETVKQHAKLLQSASQRREQGLFLCEGARLCADAAQSGIPILACYVTEKAYEKYRPYCDSVLKQAKHGYWISDHVAPLLSDTKHPQGVYCVCPIPETSESVLKISLGGKYLLLENMQDPSNLGTVLRTAEALGIAGVILGGTCCDPYSPKVLRGSMGAVFRVPMVFCSDVASAVDQMNEKGFTTLAAVVTPDAMAINRMSFPKSSVMVIGNEGNGLTAETIAACTHSVTIPMLGRAESLNASAATSILLWEMMRQESSSVEGSRYG